MRSSARGDATADVRDPVPDALEELADVLGSPLPAPPDLLVTLAGRESPFLELGSGPLRRALEILPGPLQRLPRILSRLLGLVRRLVPGLGPLVIDLREHLLQIVRRLDGAGLDPTPEFVQITRGLHHARLGVLADLV